MEPWQIFTFSFFLSGTAGMFCTISDPEYKGSWKKILLSFGKDGIVGVILTMLCWQFVVDNNNVVNEVHLYRLLGMSMAIAAMQITVTEARPYVLKFLKKFLGLNNGTADRERKRDDGWHRKADSDPPTLKS